MNTDRARACVCRSEHGRSLASCLTYIQRAENATSSFYGARLADGRTPAQALDDGDDLAVLRHLRDASSSALKSVSVQ
jgi:hypothetical protein